MSLKLLEHIEGQLGRADSKAQFTLTIDAILLASTAFLSNGMAKPLIISSATILQNIVGISAILMLILLIVSTCFALSAVIPRLFPPKKEMNVFYFESILSTSEEVFNQRFNSTTKQDFNKMILSEIYVLSLIAKKKYRLIQRSHQLLFGSLFYWVLAVLINFFFSS